MIIDPYQSTNKSPLKHHPDWWLEPLWKNMSQLGWWFYISGKIIQSCSSQITIKTPLKHYIWDDYSIYFNDVTTNQITIKTPLNQITFGGLITIKTPSDPPIFRRTFDSSVASLRAPEAVLGEAVEAGGEAPGHGDLHRKTVGKWTFPWENHRKMIGKWTFPWENHRKTHRKSIFSHVPESGTFSWENHMQTHRKMEVYPVSMTNSLLLKMAHW